MAEQILKKLQMPDGNTYVFNATQLEGKTLAEIKAETVQYLGLVNALTGLSTTAGYGDFHRVSEGFTDSTSGKSVHAGDLLVAAKANPAQSLDEANWVIVHGEEGNLITHKHNVIIEGQTLYNEAHNHTFSGTEATLKYTPAGTVAISKGTGTSNYTPEGTVALSGATAAPTGTTGVASTEHTHNVSATGSYTPEGTISGEFQAGVSDTEAADETVNVASSTHNHNVTIGIGTGAANYTPAGSVSQPTFSSGSAAKNEGSDYVFSAAPGGHTHTASYTPAGTVTGTFTGGSMDAEGTAAATTATAVSVATGAHTHTATYTPAGSINVEMNTAQANTDAIKVGSYTESTQTLSFVAASKSNFATTVKTKTFSGTQATITAGATGAANRVNMAPYNHTHAVEVSGTTAGSITGLSFSGTAATITTGANSGTNASVSKANHTHSVTGTVSKPTFTGTGVNLIANCGTASGTETVATGTHKHSVTTNGSITGLSFTGTAATISVSGTAAKTTSTAATVASSNHTHGVGTLSAAFSGTGVQLVGSFSGSQGTITYTPAGTISETTITVVKPAETVATTDPIA